MILTLFKMIGLSEHCAWYQTCIIQISIVFGNYQKHCVWLLVVDLSGGGGRDLHALHAHYQLRLAIHYESYSIKLILNFVLYTLRRYYYLRSNPVLGDVLQVLESVHIILTPYIIHPLKSITLSASGTVLEHLALELSITLSKALRSVLQVQCYRITLQN